jgi:hypothetical protein
VGWNSDFDKIDTVVQTLSRIPILYVIGSMQSLLRSERIAHFGEISDIRQGPQIF